VVRITKTAVDALQAVAGRPAFLWDDKLSGYAVKALPSGAKRYLVKYRANGGGRTGRQRWLTIGTHGQITPDEARKLAQQALAAVARGEDPQAEKVIRRSAKRLADVWQRFEEEILPLRKPSTRYDYGLFWKNDISAPLGGFDVDKITRSDIDRFHKRMRKTPYRANRILSLLSRLMTLSEAWELRSQGTNPCRYVERFKEEPRNRYLSTAEIGTLGRTMDAMVAANELSASAANAVRLLLLTGARLNEVLSSKWEWVDLDRKVIELPDSKTGAKPLFLSDVAIDVLGHQRIEAGQSEYLFPGDSETGHMINLRKRWKKICGRAGFEGVRLHDLRHTAASVAVGQGLALPLVGRLLGHSQPRTTQRYAHVAHDPALDAANKVGMAIGSIIAAGHPQQSGMIGLKPLEDSGEPDGFRLSAS